MVPMVQQFGGLRRHPGFHGLPPPMGAHSEEETGQGSSWHCFWRGTCERWQSVESRAPAQYLWPQSSEPHQTMVTAPL